MLILDGAMGTMVQTYHVQTVERQKGNNDLLCLTHPDVILDIHRRYLRAGADIITTNTFNAQRISQADYGCEHLVRDINLAAAGIARKAIEESCTPDAPRPFIAGSVGPSNKSLSISPDISDPARRAITFDAMAEAYTEQMTALLEGGVDILLIETIFDTLNAKAAIYAAEDAMNATGRRVPLMLSATVSDRAGHLLSGQTLEDFVTSVAHAHPFSIGLNCSFGAKDMLPSLRRLRQAIDHLNARTHEPIYISAYPNAGLPNQLGQYDETPEMLATDIQPFLTEGLVNIIGGCCGTTDEHIRAVSERVGSCAKSPTPALPRREDAAIIDSQTERTGAETFTNVGERCNVAGSRKFLRLIKEKAYEEAIGIARQQVEDGAMVLDINLDDGLLDTKAEMQHFLNLLAAEPDICCVPFMIDSSDFEVIRAALRCIQGKSFVNSISLKEGEAVFLDHAREIRRLGAATIVMAFDEEGQATTFERRIQVCQRAYRLLTEQAAFPPDDIIFDPNILAIATGMPEHDHYALDFIRATAWIKEHLPGAHVSGGVSNLSFSFRGNNYLREAMHAVFLYHARQAGMDMAIVNPASRVTYADIPENQLQVIEDAILARREDAAERLINLATELQNAPTASESAATSKSHRSEAEKDAAPSTGRAGEEASEDREPVAHRLVTALRRGTTDTLEADLAEALTVYPSPVAIIEGPLMEGMKIVGQLFGEGKMFLPQVVKTARTMKRAVEILRPYMAGSETTKDPSAPKILLATVKGDVHDIGKNIVATVMACNGYEVIDLGVMVPAETIVEKTLELKPDAIGLSGLITPSLEEMVNTVRLLGKAGVKIPIMIGGATTSALHTALKIAPVYQGPIVHVCDASQNVPLAARFLNAETAHEAIAELTAEQEALRKSVANKTDDKLMTLEQARANKPKFNF